MFREKELCFSFTKKWDIWARDGCLSVPTAVINAATMIWKRVLRVRMITAGMRCSEEYPVLVR